MDRCYGFANNSDFSLTNGIFADREEMYCIGLLGRIYNYNEVRQKLNKYGIYLEDDSDTELIYKSYLKWQSNFIDHINGSFLIVIYDKYKKHLLITRDPYGKYPLYYYHSNGTLYFSSDISSLLTEYSIPRNVNPQAINYYFSLRYIPQDSTIFKGVNKLSVATQLSFYPEHNKLSISRYWTFPVTDPPYTNEEELAEQLEEIIRNSIRIRYSDSFTTGVFLSGGLDSSMIVGILSNLFPTRIKTFSVNFNDSKFDESKYSGIVSDYYSTDHHAIVVDPSFSEHVDKLGSFFNEPIGDPSAIPTYYSCKLAAEHSKNVFCGEGADSLFLGMNTHEYTNRYFAIYDKAAPLLKLVGKLEGIIPDGVKFKSLFQGLTPEEFYIKRLVLFGEEERKLLLNNAIKDAVCDNLDLPESTALNILSNYKGSIKGKMSYHHATTGVDNTISMRITMANAFSLYYSTPFMDIEVAKFVSQKVNPNLRIKNGVRKYLLKKVAAKYLPPSLPINRKRGFNPPIGEWLKNEWWEFSRQLILDIKDDIINREYAETLLSEHKSGVKDNGKKLFSLMMLRLWQQSKNLGI